MPVGSFQQTTDAPISGFGLVAISRRSDFLLRKPAVRLPYSLVYLTSRFQLTGCLKGASGT